VDGRPIKSIKSQYLHNGLTVCMKFGTVMHSDPLNQVQY